MTGGAKPRDAVVESMEDGVVVLNGEDRIVDVNPAAEAIVGLPASDLIGGAAAEVLSELPTVIELLKRADVGRGEIVLKDDGERQVFDVRVSLLGDRGQAPGGRFVVFHDVTGRKRAEEALQKAREVAEAANQAKSQFLSVASHEMRTPITCIKGYTDLLAKFLGESADEVQLEFLNTIRLNADRLAGLVADLSDMARIESGRLHLTRGKVEIQDVISEAISKFRAQLDEKRQVLTVDVPPGLPAVQGDRDSLVRVTANLLSNAHKFTPAGGRITISAERQPGEGEAAAVHVAVRDDGIGIRPEELDRVFETFYRSDDRPASEMPGSGLGLSIAASLIEMQGGRIWLESVFREGTTVHFTVPLRMES